MILLPKTLLSFLFYMLEKNLHLNGIEIKTFCMYFVQLYLHQKCGKFCVLFEWTMWPNIFKRKLKKNVGAKKLMLKNVATSIL